MLGLALLLNLAGARFHGRIDLTSDHLYTLSAGTRGLLAGLPDQLTIKAYLPRTLPPELAARARYTRDLLDEYGQAGRGTVHVETTTRVDSAVDLEADACGIAETPVQLQRGHKLTAGRYRWGLCLWYDGKHRALIPSRNDAGLEYEISALIKRISSKPRKLAFTVGHGERDLGDQYSFVKFALSQEHEVVTLDPSGGAIGEDVDALVIAGPRQPFDAAARGAIADFVRRGKSAIFLLDGRTEPRGNDAGRPIDTGLGPLLARYGFAIQPQLVLDAQNAPGPIGDGDGALIANRPEFVQVTSPTPAVFPFPSPVTLVGPLAQAVPPQGADLRPLARTSGGVPLGYSYRGPVEGNAGPVRLVVIGDSSFVADRYARLIRTFPIYGGGPQLLLDTVDWALQDDALAALRANGWRPRPLAESAVPHAAAITWANAAGVPALFCAAGLLRWRWRRRRAARQRLQAARLPPARRPSVAAGAQS